MSDTTSRKLITINPNPGSRWNKNVIIMIPNGDVKSIETVRNLAKAIGTKVNATPIEWDGGREVPDLMNAGSDTRVYIVAHGDENGTSVAGVTGPMMANVLVMTAKINASVGLISLVCCYAGKEATGWGAAAINYALPSFARSFHFALGNKHKVYTLVHARSAATMVYIDFEDMDNRDFVGAKMVQTGKKTDAGVGGWEPQSIGSKYRYYWNNGTQVVSSVYG